MGTDMKIATRCRKCGAVTSRLRVDTYRVKTTCRCGFVDYLTVPEKIKSVNPHRPRSGFVPGPEENEQGKRALLMGRWDREHREIHCVSEMAELLAGGVELCKLLPDVAARLVRQLTADACSIYLIQDGELHLRATHGFAGEPTGEVRLKLGEGITGTAAREMAPLKLSNASRDPRYKVFPELNEEQYNSMLSFPIVENHEVYGVINVHCTSQRLLPEDELHFVSIMAKLIVSAIKLAKIERP